MNDHTTRFKMFTHNQALNKATSVHPRIPWRTADRQPTHQMCQALRSQTHPQCTPWSSHENTPSQCICIISWQLEGNERRCLACLLQGTFHRLHNPIDPDLRALLRRPHPLSHHPSVLTPFPLHSACFTCLDLAPDTVPDGIRLGPTQPNYRRVSRTLAKVRMQYSRKKKKG